jgi:hypothetical protein
MSNRTVLAALLLVVACSSSGSGDIRPDPSGPNDPSKDPSKVDPSAPSPADPARQGVGGTRLKARMYSAEDGAKQFIGWRDSQRNEDCNILTASDGKLRCLPSDVAGVFAGYFGDAGCTQPLAIRAKGCGAPKYISATSSGGTCGAAARYTISTAGAAVSNVWAGSPGSCNPALAGIVALWDWYSVGSAIDPASFVAATETVE